MKKAAVPSILIAVVLLAVAVIAEAQQATKIPQIGYLIWLPLSAHRPASRHSVRDCASLATRKGKTLLLNGDWATAKSIASQRLRPS